MSNRTTATAATKAPSHAVYHVRGAGKKSLWTRIGSAWAHADGKGFHVQVECWPCDGRITLRAGSKQAILAAPRVASRRVRPRFASTATTTGRMSARWRTATVLKCLRIIIAEIVRGWI